MASLIISGVIRTDLPAIYLARSMSPSSSASSYSFSAFYLNSFLFYSVSVLTLGGYPSKTHIGLIPHSNILIVLWKSPTRCPVRFPSSSLNSAILEFPYLIAYVAMIKWYMVIEASHATTLPENISIWVSFIA